MTEVAEDRRAPGAPRQPEAPAILIQSRRALALLFSLILFLVLVPILENNPFGALVLIASLYAILVTASLQLAATTGKKRWILPSILLAGTSMVFILLSHFLPTRAVVATSQGLLILFFGLVALSLFAALDEPGSITRGRLFLSVSVYLILSILWFATYRLLETLHPGSFVLMGPSGPAPVSPGLLLSLSLAMLTAVGSGDVLPIAPLARMFAGLESATGVLYVAITIARLVSAYHAPKRQSG